MSAERSLPEPSACPTDPATAFLAYLDYFRAEVRRKTSDLGVSSTTSSVPSGWTPAELVSHLVHMERRWLVWGFLGEQVVRPWGDEDASERWRTDQPLDELLDDLDKGGHRTHTIVGSHSLSDLATPGGRFPVGQPLPTLLSILFHVMQEYARHMGHLDIARELIDGVTGEG